RAGARAVVHDGGLDLVALLQRDGSRLRIAELGDVDRGLRLAADRHEGGRRTHRDHAPAHQVAGRESALASGRRALAGGEASRAAKSSSSGLAMCTLIDGMKRTVTTPHCRY